MRTIKNIFLFIGLYIANIITEIDILINVFGFFGQPGETISSHFGRMWPNSAFAKFIDILFFWQRVPSHCRHAIAPHIDPKKDLLPKRPEKYLIRIAMFIMIILFFSRLICR